MFTVRGKSQRFQGTRTARTRLLYSIVAVVIALSAILLGAPSALAQGGVPAPQFTEPTWQGSYWNNASLSGFPVLVRNDSSLNFNWGTGSPDPRISPDNFSARWFRYIDFGAGTYRFTATSDDGVRVYVDGQLIINGWFDHAPTTFTADRFMSGGEHVVMVEFYERAGGAMIEVSWSPVSQPTPNTWSAEYFNNMFLGGAPALVRNDANISFRWGNGSPAPGIVGADSFSVRWTRTLSLAPGRYRFFMTIDDGGRLWVDNNLIINSWYDSPAHTVTGDVTVSGPISVRMEYYENTGVAVAELTWLRIDTQPTPNEVIVDDTDPGFTRSGSATGWNVAFTGYNGRIFWTRNNDWQRPNYNSARWQPNLGAGWYDVYVYVPYLYTTTTRAQYWVSHLNGVTPHVVDQSTTGGTWVHLGAFQFRGNSQDYVSLSDVTFEPYLSRLIAFDAVKWVPR